MDKPTVQEIEEYMASLNIPLEQGLNGTTRQDLDPLYDVISKPKHYMLFEPSDIHPNKGIEVRDVLEVLAEKTADMMGAGKVEYSPLFISDYVQLMQYLMRFMDKNGVEDLKKARWYLDKMIESY
jgi:hypothetical protein